MIISHTHKYIFIKSWKTAGTSVEAALSHYCSGDDIVTPLGDYQFNRDEKNEWVHQSMNAGEFHQHDTALTIKNRVPAEIWNNYFKFSIARNPWERVVSSFDWHSRRNPEFVPRKRLFHKFGFPFNELKEIRKIFSRYVKEDVKTNDDFYLIDGQLCVDYVIRYENLDENLKEICRMIGLPEITLPLLKSGFRKKSFHYTEYYDDESIEIVAERHKNDIRLFGYKFN
jgi:hypothetical protein